MSNHISDKPIANHQPNPVHIEPKKVHFEDFEIEVIPMENAPEKNSAKAFDLKSLFLSLPGKLASIPSLIKDGIRSIKESIKESREQSETKRLVKAMVVREFAYTTGGKAFAKYSALGTPGMRAYATGFLTSAMTPITKQSKTEKTEAPPIHDPKLPIDKGTADGMKAYNMIKTELMALAIGEGSTGDAIVLLRDMKTKLQNSDPKHISQQVTTLLEVVDDAISTFEDADKLSDFVNEIAISNFDEVGSGGTFLRGNNSTTKLFTTALYDGILNSKPTVNTKVVDVLAENTWDTSVLADTEIWDTDKSPEKAEDRQELANSRVLMANKVFDEVFGDNASNLKAIFGDKGLAHLQRMGMSILNASIQRGVPIDEANKNVQVYFQNVIFLRGISPNFIVSRDTAKEMGVPDTEVVNYENASKGISKALQVIANQSYDDNASRLSDEIRTAYRESGLTEKFADLYKAVKMPQLGPNGQLKGGVATGLSPLLDDALADIDKGYVEVSEDSEVEDLALVVDGILNTINEIEIEEDSESEITIKRDPPQDMPEISTKSRDTLRFEEILNEANALLDPKDRVSLTLNKTPEPSDQDFLQYLEDNLPFLEDSGSSSNDTPVSKTEVEQGGVRRSEGVRTSEKIDARNEVEDSEDDNTDGKTEVENGIGRRSYGIETSDEIDELSDIEETDDDDEAVTTPEEEILAMRLEIGRIDEKGQNKTKEDRERIVYLLEEIERLQIKNAGLYNADEY